MEWFWTDVAFFGLWKFINVAVLFCIYVPVPAWCGCVLLAGVLEQKYSKPGVGDIVGTIIVFLLWIMVFALYNYPAPCTPFIYIN